MTLLEQKTRFMLVAPGRSGTGWLSDLLRSHPDISCIQEPTSRDHNARLHNHHYYWDDDDIWICQQEIAGEPTGKYSAMANYFEDKIWGLPTLAGGAKVLDHHVYQELKAYREVIESPGPPIKIIRLWRNPLRRAVSAWWAQSLKSWNSVDNNSDPRSPRIFDISEFEKMAAITFIKARAVNTRFEKLPQCDVRYGDLRRNPETELLRLQEFLGVSPKPLESKFVKLMPNDDIRYWVTNWDDIAKRVPQPWRYLLDEDLT